MIAAFSPSISEAAARGRTREVNRSQDRVTKLDEDRTHLLPSVHLQSFGCPGQGWGLFYIPRAPCM